MDSLTQVTLGAAVGTAVLGRRIGYRAALWGGICGTLPDLDVFVPFGDPVADFTYHRSFSHSLLVLTALTPLLVWLIIRIHPQTAVYKRQWFWLVWLALITHSLLDSLTIYGTQVLWPLLDTPVGIGSIFIIDPLYTVPLLVGVLGALLLWRKPARGARLNLWGLGLSTLYLGWSLVAQQIVTEQARTALAQQNIGYERLLATPAPFNTVLWRIVAMNKNHYHEGYYSLLDQHTNISFHEYPSQESLLEPLASHWPVERLRWFSKGFYKVSENNGKIIMSDLRMGLEPDYVFAFIVGSISNPHPVPAASERYQSVRDWSRLPAVLRRIWDTNAL